MKILLFRFTALFIFSIFSSNLFAQNTLEPLGNDYSDLLFNLHGSNTVGAKMAPELVRSYLQAKGLQQVDIQPLKKANEYRIQGYHPTTSKKIYVDLAAHGSTTGFKGLMGQKADIAMSSRAIKSKEVEKLSLLGDMRSFDAEKVVAIDGLAVIVHPSNPIKQLTIAQIRSVFSGEITNWKVLGGNNIPVQLYSRDNNSGTWDTFKNLVLAKKASLHDSAERFESNDELSTVVQRNPGAIGFVGLAAVGHAKALAIADQNTRALLPTNLSIATEDYPLSRRLFLYVSPYNKNPVLTEFLEFAQSTTGQNIVNNSGYISQAPRTLETPVFESAPQKYKDLIDNAERLSINIRFNNGSATLDNKAQQDVLRLSRFMRHGDNKNKEILLIGFGDSKKSQKRSILLSKLRALAVQSALRDLDTSTLATEGFGAELPVANNLSRNKLKNQRVEVWLK